MKFVRIAAIALASFVAPVAAAGAAETNFDPSPWLADLDQTHRLFATRYSNLEWAVFDHELNLNDLFAETRKRIESAESDVDARAAFDRLARKLGDGHVEFGWPRGVEN